MKFYPIISLLFLFLLLIPTVVPSKEVVRPEVLIRANIGDGEQEIGIPMSEGKVPMSEGPSSLAIDENGDIYLIDVINARLQVWNKKGVFQRSIPLPTGVPYKLGKIDYYSDIAIRHGIIALLNHSQRTIYFLSRQGRVGKKMAIGTHLSRPYRLTITENGQIFVKDSDGKVIGFSPDGTPLVTLHDSGVKVTPGIKEQLLVFGEKTKHGQEVLLIDPFGQKAPTKLLTLRRIHANYPLLDEEILGFDQLNNCYCSVTEKAAKDTEEVRIFYLRYDTKGKISGALCTKPLPRLRHFPERDTAVDKNGSLYLMASDADRSEFQIVRYAFATEKQKNRRAQ
jgi:hypothetical protein